MALSRLEQETIINWNQEEEIATLYTGSPAVYRKMKKRGYEAVKLDVDSWLFELPIRHIRLPSKPRVLSEKQRKELKIRMSAVRQ